MNYQEIYDAFLELQKSTDKQESREFKELDTILKSKDKRIKEYILGLDLPRVRKTDASQIKGFMRESLKSVDKAFEREISRIAEDKFEAYYNQAQKILGGSKFTGDSPNLDNSIIRTANQKAISFKEFYKQAPANRRNYMMQAVNDAFRRKLDSRGLTSLVFGKNAPAQKFTTKLYTNVANRVAESEVVATLIRPQNKTQELIDNEPIGYQWISVLDSGTTEYCRGNSKKYWFYFEQDRTRARANGLPLLGFEDLPPAHYGCRSYIIPITHSFLYSD